jgi:hypothetical protein
MSRFCELEKVVNRLWANPVYHASLGSKELFHTNLLAWLCESYGSKMTALFEELVGLSKNPGANGFPPLRERHDLDLVLRFAERNALVIENKIKSLPDQRQLSNYDASISKHFPGAERVLLSLIEPSFATDWVHLPYERLIPRLRAIAGSLTAFDENLVLKWCDMLDDLVTLSRLVTITDEHEDYFFLEAYELLQAKRLHGLVYRRRAQDTLSRIQALLSGTRDGWKTYRGAAEEFITLDNEEPQLLFSTGFTNERPILDVHCKLPRKPCVVGVQIQGNEFRLFGRLAVDARVPRSKSIADKEKRRSDWSEKKGGWAKGVICHFPKCFDFGAFDRFIAEEDRRGPCRAEYPAAQGRYNGFEPDFVYRSKRLVRWPHDRRKENEGLPTQMSVGDVVSLTVRHVDRFLQIEQNPMSV